MIPDSQASQSGGRWRKPQDGHDELCWGKNDAGHAEAIRLFLVRLCDDFSAGMRAHPLPKAVESQ